MVLTLHHPRTFFGWDFGLGFSLAVHVCECMEACKNGSRYLIGCFQAHQAAYFNLVCPDVGSVCHLQLERFILRHSRQRFIDEVVL